MRSGCLILALPLHRLCPLALEVSWFFLFQEHVVQQDVVVQDHRKAANTARAAGLAARSEGPGKRKRPPGKPAGDQQQYKLKQAGIQCFMQTN